MGDLERASLPLLPGIRFFPSEELLLGYYLANKNENPEGAFYGSDLIKELDLYNHYPFELPDSACFSYADRERKMHWFCYTATKDTKRRTRKVKGGFWLLKGVREIFGNGNAVLGTRTRFVFYLGNSLKDATKTDWILYEYALPVVGRVKAPFVLCRVVNKPRHENSPSEFGLSCLAEEDIPAAVRHVGVQHDGFVGTDVLGAKVCDIGFVAGENGIAANPIGCGGEHDDGAAPISVAQGSQPERLFGLPSGSAMSIEAMTSQQHILSILEEDFIELNDIA